MNKRASEEKEAYRLKLKTFDSVKKKTLKLPTSCIDYFDSFDEPFSDNYIFINTLFDCSYQYFFSHFENFEKENPKIIHDFGKKVDFDDKTKFLSYYRILDEDDAKEEEKIIFAEVSRENLLEQLQNTEFADSILGDVPMDEAFSDEEQELSYGLASEEEEEILDKAFEEVADELNTLEQATYFIVYKGYHLIINREHKYKFHTEEKDGEFKGALLFYRNSAMQPTERVAFREEKGSIQIFTELRTSPIEFVPKVDKRSNSIYLEMIRFLEETFPNNYH